MQEAAAGVVKLGAVPDQPRTRHSINDNYCVSKPGVCNPASKDFNVCSKQNKCVISCCRSCTFCNKWEKFASSRRMSLIRNFKNKVCEKCFFCRSLCFCPLCNQCPQCCICTASGRSSPRVLAKMAQNLGANPKVTSILKKGYVLPFNHRPPLVRDPLIISGYANPIRNLYLKEALQALLKKKAVERVRVRTSLAFFNRLFIVPKPNQKWRPILDLSALNKFLRAKTFKMETPETIRLSLQQGEWVILLDFSDAYFHIPVHNRSRKFLRFHFQNQTYQFRALPFGLSTAPMEFTGVVKEVKLMAQSWGIRIHQYLDDWLIRAPTRESCHQSTQSLLALCQDLGWVMNLQKSELDPKQVFEFVGYKYDLTLGLVKPTQACWDSILQKIQSILSNPTCRVRTFMSLIGLLTATEKQVPLGRLHMRPIQWHLKNQWRIPESLEKEIPIPRSLHQHLLWWTKETNVLVGQPLHPMRHAAQIFTDASKEGWGAHLGDFTANGTWSVPESHLHINFLELKAVLLALKQFQHLVQGKVVLVATDNTTVVAYINKEGGATVAEW